MHGMKSCVCKLMPAGYSIATRLQGYLPVEDQQMLRQLLRAAECLYPAESDFSSSWPLGAIATMELKDLLYSHFCNLSIGIGGAPPAIPDEEVFR